MKKIVMFLILTLGGWLILNARTGPVFLYNSPSKRAIEKLAREETPKGYAYRNYLVNAINEGLKDTTLRVSTSDISYIFENMYLEEVNLQGYYLNSGYDSVTHKMNPSAGNKFGWSFQWVFRVGTYVIIIIKEDCGNILTVPVIRIEPEPIQKQEAPPAEEKRKTDLLLRDYKPAYVEPIVTTTVKQKTWARKNWGVIVGWVATTAINTLVVGDHYNWWKASSSSNTFKPGGFTPTTD